MASLNRSFLNSKPAIPSDVEISKVSTSAPERILQFGEGNFLRAFADWMVDKINSDGHFNGRIAVAQPIRNGMAKMINDQDGLYTLFLRGIQNGETVNNKTINASISRVMNPYEEWNEMKKLAVSNDLRFVFSNTTEAGIAYVEEPFNRDVCPESFPAKLAVLLFERYKAFNGAADKGLVMIPCELIEKNGENLKKTILKLAEYWKLEAGYVKWIESANIFTNTLVDRIVPGYPREEIADIQKYLGYEDKIVVAAEIFHLWVIEGPEQLKNELPFHKSGFNVVWTSDMTPYRTRKVRVLNGAHTSSVLAAYLGGLNTVGEMMQDKDFGGFLRKGVFEEILPTLKLSEQEKLSYAESVLERFQNPFIKHELLSISLNSVSKWKVRVLPSLLDYTGLKGSLPPALTFSLAALISFYNGVPAAGAPELRGNRGTNEYPIKDDKEILEFFEKVWGEFKKSNKIKDLVNTVLSHKAFWGQDLTAIPGFADTVAADLKSILADGSREAVRKLLK